MGLCQKCYICKGMLVNICMLCYFYFHMFRMYVYSMYQQCFHNIISYHYTHTAAMLQYYIVYYFINQHRRIREISSAMHQSMTYEEWHRQALLYDEVKGNILWREEKTSHFYNHTLLSMRIADIREMVARDDVFTLMFRLRGTLKRYSV
jgi:hypothetical protein